MILITFKNGQGLGNQLWLLLTAVFLSKKLNRELKIRNFKKFKGKSLMSNYLIKNIKFFNIQDIDKEWILIDAFSFIDLTNNENIYFKENKSFIEFVNLFSNVEICGNFQSDTLLQNPEDARKLFKEFNSFSSELLTKNKKYCLINIRGGDYLGLKKSPCVEIDYFLNAMEYIKKIHKDICFYIITDDYLYASIILPNIEIIKGNSANDFKHLYLAEYLILSNSSFAYFPTFISTNLKLAIAPYKWAGSNQNKSKKNWLSPHNYSRKFIFMSTNGKIYSDLNYFKVAYSTNQKLIPNYKKFISSSKYFEVEDKDTISSTNFLRKNFKRFLVLSIWKFKRLVIDIKNVNKKYFLK